MLLQTVATQLLIMMETYFQDVKSLLKYLKYSQLTGIAFEHNATVLSLEFTAGSQGYDVVIKFFQIIHFVLSKEPNDEGSFFIGKIDLTPIEDGGKESLSSLLYPFKDREGNTISYPSKPLFCFCLEGGACIKVICGSYQIFQQVRYRNVESRAKNLHKR